MRAKIIVFPIRGRNWCFSRSIDPSKLGAQSSNTPSTFKELSKIIFASSNENTAKASESSKVEIAIDFFANKMKGGWTNLEKAPEGTIKKKIHGFGLKLLSRVKPSEIFFKAIPKEVDNVEITYPSSLNPRLVRRRLRHIAYRGSVIHKQYFYGSAILLPLTSVFMVLPLPNIAFFWVLFRTYSHWRATQGSEKLLQLVTDFSHSSDLSVEKEKVKEGSTLTSDKGSDGVNNPPWVFQPSEELQKLLQHKDGTEGLDDTAISKICQNFYLKTADVVKYKDSM